MPKSSLFFNPADYALVASRITLFYERFPTGRIVTELVSRDRDVLFKACVYRSSSEAEPAATGWASEREGDGEVNEVACVENTETSAIGRALANLGFTAAIKRPSREEMEKVERARSRVNRAGEKVRSPERVSERSEAPYLIKTGTNQDAQIPTRERIADVMSLVLEAGNRGMPAEFLQGLEQRIKDRNATTEELVAIERRVRYWLLHHAKPIKTTEGPASTSPSVNGPDQ